jgi:hypothetical protein
MRTANGSSGRTLPKNETLQNNPRYLLRKFHNVGEALSDPDFKQFAKQLRRKIPLVMIEKTIRTRL